MQSSENNQQIPRGVKNVLGQRFGHLVVKSYEGIESRKAMWGCTCDCGGTLKVRGNSLLTGRTKSCGCLQVSTRVTANTKHGMRSSRTYNIWLGMVQRATNPNNPATSYYKERGIGVCEDWLEFKNFLKDMGEAPEGLTLDRVNNDEGYKLANCRWATRSMQTINRGMFRNNKTGFRGVSFSNSKGVYSAYVNVNNKGYYLGNFPTKEAAALAYNEGALLHHGNDAHLNIVPTQGE